MEIFFSLILITGINHLNRKIFLMDERSSRESYNRIVPFKYFNQENEEIYSLGPVEEREAVLIFNEKTKTVPEEVIEYFI